MVDILFQAENNSLTVSCQKIYFRHAQCMHVHWLGLLLLVSFLSSWYKSIYFYQEKRGNSINVGFLLLPGHNSLSLFLKLLSIHTFFGEDHKRTRWITFVESKKTQRRDALKTTASKWYSIQHKKMEEEGKRTTTSEKKEEYYCPDLSLSHHLFPFPTIFWNAYRYCLK